MEPTDIRWNDAAREKILADSDRVLREAVLEIAKSQGISSDDAFAQLNGRLKDRFIDYEPGPDIRKYADAIAAGDVSRPSAAVPIEPLPRPVRADPVSHGVGERLVELGTVGTDPRLHRDVEVG